MTTLAIGLLNCRRCDDIVKLIEKSRSCECGASSGRLENESAGAEVTGPARVLLIPWESYDGIVEGEERAFQVFPRDQYRSRGS